MHRTINLQPSSRNWFGWSAIAVSFNQGHIFCIHNFVNGSLGTVRDIQITETISDR